MVGTLGLPDQLAHSGLNALPEGQESGGVCLDSGAKLLHRAGATVEKILCFFFQTEQYPFYQQPLWPNLLLSYICSECILSTFYKEPKVRSSECLSNALQASIICATAANFHSIH